MNTQEVSSFDVQQRLVIKTIINTMQVASLFLQTDLHQ